MAQLLASIALVLALAMLAFAFYFRRHGAEGAGAAFGTALIFVLLAIVVNSFSMALGVQGVPALSILSIGFSGAGAFASLQERFWRRPTSN